MADYSRDVRVDVPRGGLQIAIVRLSEGVASGELQDFASDIQERSSRDGAKVALHLSWYEQLLSDEGNGAF